MNRRGLEIEDDVVLKDRDQERTSGKNPEANLKRFDEPWPARIYRVLLDAVQYEANGYPVRAEEEALMRVMERSRDGFGVENEAGRHKSAEEEEEDQIENEEDLSNCTKAIEAIGLLREKGCDGTSRHGAFEP